MKTLFALLCMALPLYAVASKYTPAMYEKATEPITAGTSSAKQNSVAVPTYKDITGAAITHKYLLVVGSFKDGLNATNMVNQIEHKGEYKPDASFENAVALYEFDAELREILVSIKSEYPSAWILKLGD